MDSRSISAAVERAKVTSLFASLYRKASVTKHRPLTTLPFETRLEVAGASVINGGNWLHLILPDGKAAWMLGGDAARWRS